MDFVLNINGKEVSAKTEMWTLVLYEQEFGSDMLQDFFGKSKVDTDEEGIVLDFTKTNWTATVKASWACIKTKNPGIPPFRTWSNENLAVNISDLSNALVEPIMEQFFRQWGSGDPEEKQPTK